MTGGSSREQAILRSRGLSTTASVRRPIFDAWECNDAHTAAFKDWWWYGGDSFVSTHTITMCSLLAVQMSGMYATCFGWIYVCCSLCPLGFGLGELFAFAARSLGHVDPLDYRRRRVMTEMGTECGIILGGTPLVLQVAICSCNPYPVSLV